MSYLKLGWKTPRTLGTGVDLSLPHGIKRLPMARDLGGVVRKYADSLSVVASWSHLPAEQKDVGKDAFMIDPGDNDGDALVMSLGQAAQESIMKQTCWDEGPLLPP